METDLSDLSLAGLPIPALEVDATGEIVAANAAAERLLQVQIGRLPGVPLGCFMPSPESEPGDSDSGGDGDGPSSDPLMNRHAKARSGRTRSDSRRAGKTHSTGRRRSVSESPPRRVHSLTARRQSPKRASSRTSSRTPSQRKTSTAALPPRYLRWRLNYETPNVPADIRDGRGNVIPVHLLSFMVGSRHLIMFLP